jgi:fatty-acyl-CoA synthase
MTTPSHAQGPTTPPLWELTIGAALDAAVARWGDRPALVVPYQNVRWSWAELARRADEVAAGLLSLACSPVTAWASGRPTAPSGR